MATASTIPAWLVQFECGHTRHPERCHCGGDDTGTTTLVYRAYDKQGRLLYVGVTGELCVRMAQHRNLSPWWKHAARIDWVEYGDRRAALAEEAHLIAALRPPYNTAGKKAWGR